VNMPKTSDYQRASTLSRAVLIAWNCLYGLDGKALKPGQYVLVQGSGGVSTFGLQVSDTTTNPFSESTIYDFVTLTRSYTVH
jgi:NADPH:quinone reductase-like Zn-dependent oxidoreductase